MKKNLPMALVLALALTACGSNSSQPAQPSAGSATDAGSAVEQADANADQGETIYWVTAKTAEEAASGAGLDKFGVLSSIKIGDTEYKDPTFEYAGFVAQATYESGASAVYLRKGEGYYATPLSDRALDEFGARWFKNLEGMEVSCYGPAKGAVTVATWTDGAQSFGLTFQGLGGEEMSMDSDELATIVKGIHEANAYTEATEEKKEEKAEEKKSDEKPNDTLLSAADAEKAVEKDSGADCKAIDLVSTKKYGDCWYAVCVADDGTRYEYYVDNDGAHLVKKEKVEQKQEEKKEEEKKEAEKKDEQTAEHKEGEAVTIYGSIYAEWHQINGQWYATFVTYNGTQIFAQTSPAGGGWVFNAFVDGNSVQVVYNEMESTQEDGKTGPAGASSHWKELNGDRWF